MSAEFAEALRVLVVEDEAVIAEEVCERLSRAGYLVAGVADTAEGALRLARELRPDVALLDIRLKGPSDGIVAGERIQLELGIPVVYLTAHSDQGTLSRIASNFGYVLKPFQERTLLVTLRLALERHQAQKRLLETEFSYSAVLRCMTDAVLAVDASRRVRFVNAAAEKLLGWSLAELSNREVVGALSPHGEAFGPALLRAALEEKRPLSLPEEAFVTDRYGNSIPVGGSVAPLDDHGSRHAGAVLLLRDLREQRRAQLVLREQATMLRLSQEVSHSGSFEWDPQTQEVRWSEQMHRIYGVPAGEFAGTFEAAQQFVLPEDRARLEEKARKLTETGEGSGHVFRIRRADGEVRWLFGRSAFVEATRRVVGTVVDVTEKHLREAHALEQEQVYRGLLEHSPIPTLVVTADRSHKIEVMNRRFTEVFGYTLQEVWDVDSWWPQAYPDPEYRAQIQRAWREAQQRAEEKGAALIEPIDAMIRCRDGTQRYVRVHMGMLEGRAIVLFNDLSEQRWAEHALESAGELWRQSFDALTDLVAILDLDGRILRANRALRTRLEPSCGPLEGQDYRTVYYGPEAQLTLATDVALSGGGPLFQEGRLARLPGEFLIAAYPLRRRNGAPAGAVHVVREVTQQRALEAQVRQAGKMQAIGQLAGGVAHDFNNLLMVILSYAEALLEGVVTSEAESRDALLQIREAAERAGLLTRQLLTLGRKAVLSPRALDLSEVLRRMRSILERVLGEDLTLRFHEAPELPSVLADVMQLEQVLLNLCLNARDAMPRGGTLTVSTDRVSFDAAHCARHPTHKPGDFVRLAVSDTGFGIRPELMNRIFEPFFTTKKPGKGTGMGLATVYSIAQQSGGFVTVQSTPGAGTTFEVFLPVSSEAPASLEADSAPARAHGAGEVILLVEDEAAVRRVSRAALERFGYRVYEATSGAEALRLCEQLERVDLLLTDVVMPEMSGRELARQVQQRRPELPVLFMSGYDDDAIARHGIGRSTDAFLQKPVEALQLAQRVRQLLDARAS